MKLIFRSIGILFLALGGIGIFLPIWPTTIFWIIAALCFVRSSEKMRDWIYSQPGVGSIVENFVERGTLDSRSKRMSCLGMIGSGLIASAFIYQSLTILILTWAGLSIGIVFVMTRPEK